MDQSAGQEREHLVQDERAAARERVQAAQDQEVKTRVGKQVEKQQQVDERARERRRVAADDASARGLVARGADGEGDSPIKPDIASV